MRGNSTRLHYAWIAAGVTFFTLLAAYGAGALRTVTGTYALAFFSAGALCVIAALVVLSIGKTRRNGPQVATA